MDDLHLTDEQVNELKTIKPMGLAAAYELLYWRQASPGPWLIAHHDGGDVWIADANKKDGMAIQIQECVPYATNTHQILKDAEAAIFSRNTSELRAAAIYWGRSLLLCEERSYYRGTALGEESEEFDKAEEACRAITEALESLCQVTPQPAVEGKA